MGLIGDVIELVESGIVVGDVVVHGVVGVDLTSNLFFITSIFEKKKKKKSKKSNV